MWMRHLFRLAGYRSPLRSHLCIRRAAPLTLAKRSFHFKLHSGFDSPISLSGCVCLSPHRCLATSTGSTYSDDPLPMLDNKQASEWARAPPSLRQTLPPDATELPEYSFLKCIEKEIMDEKLRIDKADGPPPFPLDWEFYHPEGTSLMYGRRIWVPPVSRSFDEVEVREREETLCTPSTSFSSGTSGAGAGKGRRAERHFIRGQLTTRDASLDPECDIRGEHFPFSLFVQPLLEEDVENKQKLLEKPPPPSEYAKFFQEEELSFLAYSIEVRCDLIDGELRAEKVIVHGELDTKGLNRLPTPVRTISTPSSCTTLGRESEQLEKNMTSRIAFPYLFNGYEGPNLDEAEEDVLDGLQAWLAERRMDDLLGEFVGSYSVWIEQMEYERWLQHLHDYVAA